MDIEALLEKNGFKLAQKNKSCKTYEYNGFYLDIYPDDYIECIDRLLRVMAALIDTLNYMEKKNASEIL